jgi:hypothetical protein
MHEIYHQYTCFSLFAGVLPLLSSSRAGSFADAGMADDGGDREGKELGEQQLVAATASVVVPIVVSQKKLLVLDVNGLLVATYYKQETLPPEPYHVKLGNFYGDTSMLHVFFSFSLSLSLSLFGGEFFFHVVIVAFDDSFVKEKRGFQFYVLSW